MTVKSLLLALALIGPAAPFPALAQFEPGLTKAEDRGIVQRVRMRDVLVRLSPEGRQVFADTLKAQRENFGSRGRSLREVRAQIADAMQAEPFKPDVLRRLFARERELSEAEQAKRHETTVTAMSKLSVEDRKVFAQMLLGGKPRPHRGGPEGAGPPQ